MNGACKVHGNTTHGMRHSPLYIVWRNMKTRCEKATNRQYKDYGGRGVTICSEWHDASTFLKWALENGYREGLVIDRTNNNGDYCPENCRFVDRKTNMRNRSNTVFLTLAGERRSVAEWCEILRVKDDTARHWLRRRGDAYAERRLLTLMEKVKEGQK